jgi:hypothetical protein
MHATQNDLLKPSVDEEQQAVGEDTSKQRQSKSKLHVG